MSTGPALIAEYNDTKESSSVRRRRLNSSNFEHKVRASMPAQDLMRNPLQLERRWARVCPIVIDLSMSAADTQNDKGALQSTGKAICVYHNRELAEKSGSTWCSACSTELLDPHWGQRRLRKFADPKALSSVD